MELYELYEFTAACESPMMKDVALTSVTLCDAYRSFVLGAQYSASNIRSGKKYLTQNNIIIVLD